MAAAKKQATVKRQEIAPKTTKAHFSKKEAIRFGFALAKQNIIFFIGLFVVVVIISALTSSIQFGVALAKQPFLYLVIYIAIFIVNTIIGMGLIKISLEFVDRKKPQFSDLFQTKNLVNFILASLIRGVITLIGFILLIIPGIIFSIRLQYVTYLIIDKNLPPVDAVKKSWDMTKGNAWNLFFLGILLFLINVLGAIILLVGLFVTVPLTMLATTFVYRKLLLQSKSA
jgi:uncharacterized membrane protein